MTDSHVLAHSSTTTYLIDLETHQSVWQYDAGGHVGVSDSQILIAGTNGELDVLSYKISPSLTAVAPSQADFFETPAPVVISGVGFLEAGNLQVFFGEQEATVSSMTDTAITCTPPDLGPGKVDVRVVNDNGEGILDSSFSYVPLLEMPAPPVVGGSFEVILEDVPGAGFAFFLGSAPATALPLPPFHGVLGTADPAVFLSIPEWPFDSFGFQFDLPDEPALVGASAVVQVLARLKSDECCAAFTNPIEFTIGS